MKCTTRIELKCTIRIGMKCPGGSSVVPCPGGSPIDDITAGLVELRNYEILNYEEM